MASIIVSRFDAQPRDSRTIEVLTGLRRMFVIGGLIALLLAALVGGDQADRLAQVALIAFTAAAASAWAEGAFTWRMPARRIIGVRAQSRAQHWLIAILALATLTSLAAQTWFRTSTVIAGGDIAPPAGIAWISRLFSAWTWSGSNLGGPSALESQLPWATVLGLVHAVGGSPELAQRTWYTILFVAASLAGLAFLSVLGLRPLSSTVGAAAYVFSPFVVANVVPNPVYLAALGLLPAIPALVIAAGRAQMRLRLTILLMGATAPMLGYVYQNPPLVGMLIGATLLTPLVAAWVVGPAVAYRASIVVAFGLGLMLAVSAYWIVPSVLQLHNSLSGWSDQLTTASSWIWTQDRSTILNAFWLNTAWGWRFPEYFPFASTFDTFPLSLIKFGPATLAFAALAVGRKTSVVNHRLADERVRLAAMASTIALALIFLSTGTNPPGNILFDHLYAMPFGWLLREPGRFLFVAALMYAVLISVAIDELLRLAPPRPWTVAALLPQRAFVAVPVAVLLILVPGLPLLTGGIVSDRRPLLPPPHVQVPSYWMEMATFLDGFPSSGAVLVMPPDDFYQMPYSWGYYGNDGWVVDLINRPTLIPSAQGYFAASSQLVGAVGLASTSILGGNWQEVGRLMTALGTPLVLVRGDLDTSFPGRTFPSPTGLNNALLRAPNFELIHSSGPLHLYRLQTAVGDNSNTPGYFATVDTPAPDLRVLASLPDDAVLISASPQPGIPNVQQSGPLTSWRQDGKGLAWDFIEQPDRTYTLVPLSPSSDLQRPGVTPAGSPVTPSFAVTHLHGDGAGGQLEVTLSAKEDLANGSFETGPWQPVADCAAFSGDNAKQYLSATAFPVGGPDGASFLRLSAQLDSACESHPITWQGGSVVVTVDVRHLAGEQPRICLWEIGVNRCAPMPPISASSTWTTYKALITPDSAATALQLFAYADVYVPYRLTQNDYANFHILGVGSPPGFDLVGNPVHRVGAPALVVDQRSYSSNLEGPPGSSHVLVDGLSNGWLVSKSRPFAATYTLDNDLRAGFLIALLGLLGTIGLAASMISWRELFRRWRRGNR